MAADRLSGEVECTLVGNLALALSWMNDEPSKHLPKQIRF